MSEAEIARHLSEPEFVAACGAIDQQAVVDEIFGYLLNGAPNYVDNSDTAYLLYFVGETLEALPALASVHSLYGKGPKADIKAGEIDGEETEEDRCITAFLAVISSISQKLKDDPRLKELFDVLISYYDTKIMIVEDDKHNKTIAPFTEKLDGYVDMDDLIYEPFPVELKVKRGAMRVDQKGKVLGKKRKKVVKKIVIPAGFCLQFEVVYWRPKDETTLPSVSF